MDAGLFLEIEFRSGDPLAVFKSLIEAGWRANDYGNITYLPVGDDGEFDWQSMSGEKLAELNSVLMEKVELSELIGVVLCWRDTDTGGCFLLSGNEITFSASINRKTLDGKATDVSWYLEKIIPAIKETPGTLISRWQWNESWE